MWALLAIFLMLLLLMLNFRAHFPVPSAANFFCVMKCKEFTLSNATTWLSLSEGQTITPQRLKREVIISKASSAWRLFVAQVCRSRKKKNLLIVSSGKLNSETWHHCWKTACGSAKAHVSRQSSHIHTTPPPDVFYACVPNFHIAPGHFAMRGKKLVNFCTCTHTHIYKHHAPRMMCSGWCNSTCSKMLFTGGLITNSPISWQMLRGLHIKP